MESEMIKPARLSMIFFVMLFLITSAIAATNNEQKDFDNSFQDGIKAAASANKNAMDVLGKFDPEHAFNNYTSNPQARDYYNQDSDDSLNQDKSRESSESPIASEIRHVDKNQDGIDKKNLHDETAKISEIQKHAADIAQGISDEFADCTKQQSCTTEWTEKSCDSAPVSQMYFCKQTLDITEVPRDIRQEYPFSFHLYNGHHSYAGVSINLVTGAVVSLWPHKTRLSHAGNLPESVIQTRIEGKITEASSRNPGIHVDAIDYPSTGNPVFSFHISGGRGDSADISLNMTLTSIKTVYDPVDHWRDECSALASTSGCSPESSQCVISRETHNINGFPVTRDCWEKELQYMCSRGSGVDTCKSLRDDGCEQVSFACTEEKNGACIQYHRIYHCPVRTCKDTGVICNGKTYCLTGDCVSHEKNPDQDFQKAASALSASLDAGANFNGTMIFAGSAKKCDDLILGAANCCRNTGWLVDDLSLYHCTSSEKELGKARENGQSHYVGRQKSGCILGGCLKKTKIFCVFPSMLARIIQEQGREEQLGRHFGSAKHPDCSGITPEELQKIDFSHIDFSDFYSELEKKKTLMSHEEMERRISEKMQELINEGKSHGKKLPA